MALSYLSLFLDALTPAHLLTIPYACSIASFHCFGYLAQLPAGDDVSRWSNKSMGKRGCLPKFEVDFTFFLSLYNFFSMSRLRSCQRFLLSVVFVLVVVR